MRRYLTTAETRRIGHAIGDNFVAFGHPLTCNGGNPDWRTHHDHEVVMQLDEHPLNEPELVCPECGRAQQIPGLIEIVHDRRGER